VIVDAINGTIVGGVAPDQNIGIIDFGQLSQNLGQVRRTEFAGSAGAAGKTHEPRLFVEKSHSFLLVQC